MLVGQEEDDGRQRHALLPTRSACLRSSLGVPLSARLHRSMDEVGQASSNTKAAPGQQKCSQCTRCEEPKCAGTQSAIWHEAFAEKLGVAKAHDVKPIH